MLLINCCRLYSPGSTLGLNLAYQRLIRGCFGNGHPQKGRGDRTEQREELDGYAVSLEPVWSSNAGTALQNNLKLK